MKQFKSAHEIADEIERLNELEKTQVLELRLSELQRQQAEISELRAKKELERTQRDKDHCLAILSISRMTAQSKMIRDLAVQLDGPPAPKN